MNFLDRSSKKSNIRVYENPSGGSRVVPRGWKEGRTDMTRLIFALAMLRTSLIMINTSIYPVDVPQLKSVFHECSTKETESHTSIDWKTLIKLAKNQNRFLFKKALLHVSENTRSTSREGSHSRRGNLSSVNSSQLPNHPQAKVETRSLRTSPLI